MFEQDITFYHYLKYVDKSGVISQLQLLAQLMLGRASYSVRSKKLWLSDGYL